MSEATKSLTVHKPFVSLLRRSEILSTLALQAASTPIAKTASAIAALAFDKGADKKGKDEKDSKDVKDGAVDA